MNKFKLLLILGLALLLVGVSATMWAAPGGPPSKDTLNVTAKTSGNGFAPTVPGNSPTQWRYEYCLASGSSINDTFPVDFAVTNTNSTTPQSYTIHLHATGNLAGSATVPADFGMSDDGSTTTQTISISTGALADGDYVLNVQISDNANPSGLQIPHDTVHIHVTVGAGCNPGPSCFFTSSDFNFLQDCSGADVSTNSGGTFQIVPNAKGKVVATNPGQFYYNMIWTNTTGASQTVTVTFNSSGLNTTGANSVHALTFNSSGFTADASAFDMVNQNGTPCGPSGPCTITVAAGDTLWVTWHVEYSGIGGSAASISNSCPGNQTITATGTIKDSDGNTLATCMATASGYLKK